MGALIFRYIVILWVLKICGSTFHKFSTQNEYFQAGIDRNGSRVCLTLKEAFQQNTSTIMEDADLLFKLLKSVLDQSNLTVKLAGTLPDPCFPPNFNVNVRDQPTGNTVLNKAVENEEETLVSFIVNNGADLNAANNQLLTPLHSAALLQNKTVGLRLIKVLLETGANPDLKDYRGLTFLHRLLRKDSALTMTQFEDFVDYLVKRNLTRLFNEMDPTKKVCSPFLFAVIKFELTNDTFARLHSNGVNFNSGCGDTNTLSFAIDYGKSLNTLANLVSFGTNWKLLNDNRDTVLHTAADMGHVEALKYFLGFSEIPVDSGNIQGSTPLHLGILAEKNSLEVIQILHDFGANFNDVDNAGRTPLLYAIQSGRGHQLLVRLVQFGVNWKILDSNNNSVLHASVEFQNVDALEYCLTELEGLDVNALNGGGFTPLHYAVTVARDDIIAKVFQLLDAHGADFGVLDENGLSLLSYAISTQRNSSVLASLIGFGTDWRRLDNGKNNLLQTSAKYGNLAALQFFIGFKGLDLNSLNSEGYAPLHQALSANDNVIEIIQLLKDHNANFEVLDNDSRNILYYAIAFEQSREVFEKLIEFGADPRHLDRENNSLLHFAAEVGNNMALRNLMYKKGVQIDRRNSRGQTPLHLAALHASGKDGEVMQAFWDNKADFNGVDNGGRSILSYAVEGQRDSKMLSVLVAYGAKVDLVFDKDNNSFVHDASRYGNLEALQFLWNKSRPGVPEMRERVNARNFKGEVPLHFAVFYPKENALKIVEYLYANGASLKAVTKNGSSVLSYAVRGKRDSEFLNRLVEFGADSEELAKLQGVIQTVGRNTGVIITVSLAASVVLLILISVALTINYRKSYRLLSKAEVDKFRRGLSNGSGDSLDLFENMKFPDQFSLDKSNFVLLSLIGKGNFGLVYKATLTINGDELTAAVKIPKSDSSKDELRTMLSEVKLLSYVGSHSHIVTFIGAYIKEIGRGVVYIATEMCDNGSLENHLRSLPWNETTLLSPENFYLLIRFAYEVALGMSYISSKKVIHGDLATRNVLLDSFLRCKIGDFGLSRKLYQYEQYIKKSEEPVPWKWMAPEALARMEFSTKSDVWSYGVVLWEIFSLGSVPYSGVLWTQEFVEKLKSGMRMASPSFAPEEIYKTMLECWLVDPETRPTFSELGEKFSEQMHSEYATLK